MSELDSIWRALSDPTRRQVLDLLRDGPRTTGDLAASFPMSRFGVMKHLGILESAGLLTVKRKGRERWNYLNAVPIRQLYERWVGKYSELWSSTLVNLKELTETQQGESEMRNFEIVQSVEIRVPREKVWKALTTDIGRWWAFHLADEPSEVSLQPRLGGHFVERWGDGEGALWGVVTYLKAGDRLRLEGALGMTGPGHNRYTYDLEQTDTGTKVTVTHYCYGFTEPETEQMYKTGWEELFNTYLKGYLEDGATWEQLKKG